MERIIDKLNKMENSSTCWNDWSVDDKKQLLNIYYSICKKEHCLFDLIYRYHYCDSWEDIFCDYDEQLLVDKATGVKVAINNINELQK